MTKPAESFEDSGNSNNFVEKVLIRKEWRRIDSTIRSAVETLTNVVMFELQPDNPLSSKAFLSDLYLEKGRSAAQIAKEIVSSGCSDGESPRAGSGSDRRNKRRHTVSKSAVLSALKKFQIPIRERYKPHKRESQTRYGQKRLKGKTVSYKREEEIIGVIKDLTDKGLSLREVCQILTSMKIPTKNKFRKWHPEIIRRILEANKG